MYVTVVVFAFVFVFVFAPGSASPPRTHTIYNDKDKNKGKDKGKNKDKDKGKDNDSNIHKYWPPLKLVCCVVLVEFLLTLRMDRNWMKVWAWVGQSTLAHVRQINSCVGANDQERWAGVVVFSPGDRCDALQLSSVMGGKLCCWRWSVGGENTWRATVVWCGTQHNAMRRPPAPLWPAISAAGGAKGGRRKHGTPWTPPFIRSQPYFSAT